MATCNECGVATPDRYAADDPRVIFDRLCSDCYQRACERMRFMRREFEALLARGISNEEANRIMLERHQIPEPPT